MNDNELSSERRHEIDASTRARFVSTHNYALDPRFWSSSKVDWNSAKRRISNMAKDTGVAFQSLAYANLLCDFGHGNLVLLFTDAYVY